jgi:membrane-bound lytic murein transglycosylase D
MYAKKVQGLSQAQGQKRAQILTSAFTQTKPTQQKLIVGLLSLLLLAGGAIHAQHAAAADSLTDNPLQDNSANVSGVVIEVITDPNDSVLASEPVQDYLDDTIAVEQVQTDLWARIKDGYAMPNTTSGYTQRQENWYASNPDYLKRMLGRSQKYLFHIVEEVQKRNMPTEIALLPMIESAFNPQAYSRSRASGIWQFIPSTGKHFGLQQNWWVDNRRDVTAATDAALNYLEKLHGMFGSWDLALAAYNAGEGTVQRAINRNRDAGLPTDYASLSLPEETRNYVPKLQAIKNIITNPQKFGLNVDSIPNRPYFARVTTPKQIDSKLAAELAEISYEEFSALNPSYNRPVITSQGEKHQLLLPVWAAERFAQNLANYDKPLSNWQTYNAKRGESLDNIAQKFGMDVSQLRQANGLSSGNRLHADRAMLVALANNGQANATDANSNLIDETEMENNNVIKESAARAEPKREEAKTEREQIEHRIEHIKVAPVIHKVKRGDTLLALAAKYDTDTKTLMKLNHLKNGQLKAGQKIQLTEASVKTVEISSKHSKNKLSKNESAKNESTKSKLSDSKVSKNDKANKEKYSHKKTIASRDDDTKSKKNVASKSDKSKSEKQSDKRSLVSELISKKTSSRRTSVRSNVRIR